jgi:23S rRNA pseudouridine1911/1915/1917 synthase
MKMESLIEERGARGGLQPRFLRLEIGEEDDGKTIRDYLMKKIGFSARQISRFKYRKEGIMLNGERRYVNAPLHAGDVLQLKLTQGGEPAEEQRESPGNPGKAWTADAGENSKNSKKSSAAGQEGPGRHCGELPAAGLEEREAAGGYLRARDGRLQKIWAAPAAWLSENYPLSVLYEDQDILAADKASGVVCHPSPGHYNDTLSNQVADHLGCIGRELDVRVTGRLDRDTSGIVIFALNTETAAQLIRQRQASMMQKLYIARLRGLFSNQLSGTIDRPLRRESPDSFRMMVAEDGKAARTHYRVLRQMPDGTSLVACRIEHGRTHQIRVHMASIGHPIVGDRLYGPEAVEEEVLMSREQARIIGEKSEQAAGSRQAAARTVEERHAAPLMLHAWQAVLRQPFTGEEIRLEAPLPEWAEELNGLTSL